VLARITPFSYETEEAKEVFVPISLPEDMPSGVAKIVVTYGRPWEYSTGDSLEEAIANFENADHYNELVVKFNPPEGEETIKFKVTTDWVLEGYVKFRKKV
jgi:hypothetical protein